MKEKCINCLHYHSFADGCMFIPNEEICKFFKPLEKYIELNKPYSSKDYVIVTEQEDDTQTFIVKKRK